MLSIILAWESLSRAIRFSSLFLFSRSQHPLDFRPLIFSHQRHRNLVDNDHSSGDGIGLGDLGQMPLEALLERLNKDLSDMGSAA